MGWTADNSRKRIKSIADDLGTIEIADLGRQMDLSNVERRRPKRITGTHLYLGVANEQRLVDDLLDAHDREAAKAPARHLHLFQRAAARTVDKFDLARVHFQGARLHAINYRPGSDHQRIAVVTVAAACAVDLAMREAFNPGLKDDPDLKITAGAAFGQSLATKSGPNGDSELLFVGDAANQGAKAMNPSCRLRVTPELFDLLDLDKFGITAHKQSDGRYTIEMGKEAIESVAERYDLGWTLDWARKGIEDDAEKITLDSVSVSKACAEIDKDRLGLSNCKLNQALSVFGDLDGFTAIVEAAMSDDTKLAALVRDFHITRSELRHIAVQDYKPTLRVQFQGDRTQLLRHLPHDDAPARTLNAVKIAAAWNSR